MIPESQCVINNIVSRLQTRSERVGSVWESRVAKNSFNNKSADLNIQYKHVIYRWCVWQQSCVTAGQVCDVGMSALTALAM